MSNIYLSVYCFWNWLCMNPIWIGFIGILSIFNPILYFYYLIIILSTLNMITALWDDIKKGGKFNKKKFGNYISRIILYVISISAVFLFEKILLSNFGYTGNYLTNVVTGLLATFELNSSLVNMGSITGLTVFKSIVDKIKKKCNEILK